MSEKARNMPASVRQRLLNLARERKDEFQLVLVRYGVERLLYRLSVSPDASQFVLKGAMLFELWTGRPHRSTTDVDLLGSGDDDVNRLVTMFQRVCSRRVEDDGLAFWPESIHGGLIREDQRYGGVRIEMMATLERSRIPIKIDIGFGDAITPSAEQVRYPTLLGLPAPIMLAYPKVTAVAEKYEAMVSLGIANSRMKDFYDVWVLARDFDFDGNLLGKAIGATFARRRTVLPGIPPTALTSDFANDKAKQSQWTAFVRRGRLAVSAPAFGHVVELLHSFLWTVSERIVRGDGVGLTWVAGGPWKQLHPESDDPNRRG